MEDLKLGSRYGILEPTGQLDADGKEIKVTTFEVLVVKPGVGGHVLTLDGKPLEKITPKVLPSAD